MHDYRVMYYSIYCSWVLWIGIGQILIKSSGSDIEKNNNLSVRSDPKTQSREPNPQLTANHMRGQTWTILLCERGKGTDALKGQE